MRDGQKTERARQLRQNATDAERALWRLLRDRRLAGVKFRRQVPIGPYVADFACVRKRLVIEIDGGQHAESSADARRDEAMRRLGWRVVRFWNSEALENPEGMLERIGAEVGIEF